MNRAEHLQLLGEKSALERMIAETPDDDVLDRASLTSRLKTVATAISRSATEVGTPARVRLTFRGRPVVGSHGIFAEFGMKAVNGYADAVTAMAASLAGPLAATGPLPNREQHQLLITRTALGSFGFDLEEHQTMLPPDGETTPVALAIDRTQRLLHGTLGSDDELADSADEADRRALDRIRTFLQTLVDHEAVCSVQLGQSVVSFSDVGQVRSSLARLSQENLREAQEELQGQLQGVLPKARAFEFKREDTGQVIRGKIGPAITDPDSLNNDLHRLVRIRVMATSVGNGRPRYLLLEPPTAVA